MSHTNQQRRLAPRARNSNRVDGIDFVRCRICGDHRRVLSARHLSKHGTDREEYMQEYNLSPDGLIAKDFRIIQSSRRGYHPYGKSDWIAAIKKIYRRDGNIFARRLQIKHPHLYTQGTWIFGDWDKALCAAGFDPERMRLRISWDREKINTGIRALRKQNLPLYAKYVMKNHQKLFSGALAAYRSWNKALLAAGVTNKEIPRKTRLGLLREFRDTVESRSDISEPLRLQLSYYFGSPRNAKTALKTDAKLLSGWSKRKIITVLAQKHRSKEKLSYGTVRRECPALVSAAEAYFGSWGKALHAARIDPNLYFVHHTWRKQQVSHKEKHRVKLG
jgi:hypothetical protein